MSKILRGFTAVAVASSAVALAACSSSSAEDSDSVEVALLADISGAAAFCGADVRDAARAAVKKANQDDMLDGKTIELVEYDTGSDPREGATAMSEIASSDAVATIFGCASGVAVAAAPIAQDEQVPFVAMQSGTDGIVDQGDYIFRTTAPQATFQGRQVDYWADQNVKDVAIAYQGDNPTLVELAEEIYPPLLEDAGMEIVSTDEFAADTVDFSGIASDIVKADPDAVLVEGQGTPNVTLITQLVRSGYDGLIGASAGVAGDVLKPLGKDANGITYPTDFHPDASYESTKQFLNEYTDITGVPKADVDQFVAETWDATMFTIEAIGNADEASRDDVRDELEALTGKEYDGAVGPITFAERSAEVEGLLVKRKDGDFVVVDQS
ncbi:MAG: ABC transporter substrate-binding protein [Actinomycetia bacterium]|nr:ABC transporter substrate-binding protein [Actinomycetes bacterium]